MPIGLSTAAIATIGAGVIGAGATIYGASKASHAQTQAADTAAAAQSQASADNNQLARDMYGANAARLDPYSNMGLAAGDEYMGLLLGNSPTAGGTNKSSGWAPVVGSPTGAATGPAPGATPGLPAAGYTGPALGQITSQSQMDAYLAYYRAHPEIAPPFSDTSPFHGDPFVDENAAGSILAAHNAYTAAHPTAPGANALAPFAGATPAAPITPAPANAISPVVQQQAAQAIAAGADPAAVQQRFAQIHGLTQ